jgi:hypothetical protein
MIVVAESDLRSRRYTGPAVTGALALGLGGGWLPSFEQPGVRTDVRNPRVMPLVVCLVAMARSDGGSALAAS